MALNATTYIGEFKASTSGALVTAIDATTYDANQSFIVIPLANNYYQIYQVVTA